MVYIGTVLYIIGAILTDVSYALVNPRVRLDRGKVGGRGFFGPNSHLPHSLSFVVLARQRLPEPAAGPGGGRGALGGGARGAAADLGGGLPPRLRLNALAMAALGVIGLYGAVASSTASAGARTGTRCGGR